MNPFDLLVAVALYEDPKKDDLKGSIAICMISLILQFIYWGTYSYLYGNLLSATEDMTSNQQQGPQKNSRRFRKWAAGLFAIIAFTQIIIGFVDMKKATYPEAGWIVVFNGVLLLTYAVYILLEVFTTLPLGDRIKTYKDVFYVFWLFLYAIVAFVGARKIRKNDNNWNDYTTFALMGVVGLLGGIAIILNAAFVWYRSPTFQNNPEAQNQNASPRQNQDTTHATTNPSSAGRGPQQNSNEFSDIF